MYVLRMDAFLNRWFTSYDEARRARAAAGERLSEKRDMATAGRSR
jgi:hypothetical protein